jgi:hypothetical protein
MSIRKFRAARVTTTTASTFVGQPGDMFYDEQTGQLKISDGHTPGGHYINLVVATSTQLGGIKAGPGAVVGSDGLLTIDTSGLPLNVGNLAITYANISTTNANQDLNLLTNGTGNINLIGNLRVQTTSAGLYSTPVFAVDNRGNLTINGNLITNGGTYLKGNVTFVGATVHQGNITTTGNLIVNGASYFVGTVTEVGNLTITGNANIAGPASYYGPQTTYGATVFNGNVTTNGNINIAGNLYQTGNNIVTGTLVQYGSSTFVVTQQDSTTGAIEITGDANGQWQTPVNTGVMLQVTGQANNANRVYFDSLGSYSVLAGRRFEGSMASPTGVQGNVDLFRVAGTPYTATGWANIGPARMSFVTNEIQTSTNQGGRIEFWTTANSAGPAWSTVSRTATIDPALGVTATGFVTSGNLSVGNVSVTNNETVGGNVTVGNTFIYSTATGDAGSVTQSTNKSTAVTSNGRSGRIVMNGAALTGQNYVTFTVNNNYIKNTSDVPIVTIQNPITTPNNYLVSVSNVAVGSFNITLYNADSGAGSTHSDAVVLNYAIIRVGS